MHGNIVTGRKCRKYDGVHVIIIKTELIKFTHTVRDKLLYFKLYLTRVFVMRLNCMDFRVFAADSARSDISRRKVVGGKKNNNNNKRDKNQRRSGRIIRKSRHERKKKRKRV